ncbi:MAG: fused MFS/spermidine synthase [Verrucomicrobiota bacterium]
MATGKKAEGTEGKVTNMEHWGSVLRVRLILGSVCFFSGASVMVIEITGNRLLAPIFGNSIYTWTALIGVVLVAFSVGGYMGGWLADRSPSTKVLGLLLVASSVLTILIPPIWGLTASLVSGMGLIGGPVTLSFFLFVIPGVLLGAVSPFTVRLLAHHTGDRKIGAAAGLVGMLGSLGSFTGTFLSGFVLIPNFGVRQIFLVTGGLLLVLGMMVFLAFRAQPDRSTYLISSGILLLSGILFFLVPAPWAKGKVFDELTFYHWIRVFDSPTGPDRTVRTLMLDSTTEGAQVVETGELTVPYQRYWELMKGKQGVIERSAFLGAGAFGMPQQVARNWPEAEVDVVEIDPEVIRAGRECFRLGDYENVQAYAMDARRFLALSDHQYDVIFGDAYNGVRYIPAHLTTAEFFEEVKERLNDGGVFMMNLISGLTGDRAPLFEALFTTIDSVFENVEVFSTSPYNYREPHNIILVAGDGDLGSFVEAGTGDLGFDELVATRVDPSVYATAQGQVLTDDRNPVEFIVARQLEREASSVGGSY